MSKYTAEQMEERMANVERRLDLIEGNATQAAQGPPDIGPNDSPYESSKSGDIRDIPPAGVPSPRVPDHWKAGDEFFVPTSVTNPLKASEVNTAAGTVIFGPFDDGSGLRDWFPLTWTQIRRIFPNPNGD